MRTPALAVAILLLGLAGVAAGQPSLRAEKTVKYQTGNSISFDVRVGPVKVTNLKITVGSPGGLGSALKSKVARLDPETQTSLQFAFDAENPNAEQWQVTYTIEFLNAKGELVDRFGGKDKYEGEAKTSTFDHVILKAALPLVDSVRVKWQAARD